MSAEKLSPRQQMIGIMYLVLLAMLAMNASKDLLDAFLKLESGIDLTANNFVENVQPVYDKIESAAANNSSKAKATFKNSKIVKSKIQEINTLINTHKKWLIDNTGGVDENGIPLAKDNQDIGAEYLMTKGHGEDLRKQITALKSYITGLIDKKDTSIRQSVATLLATDEYKDYEGNKTSWEAGISEHLPLAAVTANLSNIQSYLRNTESITINYLFEELGIDTYKVNKIQAATIAQSSYVLQGEEYKAQIFLAASDTTQQPIILVGDYDSDLFSKTGQLKFLSKTDTLNIKDGFGNYTSAGSSVGEHSWKGVVRIPHPNPKRKGEFLTYPFENKYLVAQPSAVVSSDKLNIMYMKLANEMTISVPGISSDKIRVTNSKCTITKKGNGQFIFTPNAIGKTDILVQAEVSPGRWETMGSYQWMIKKLPKPELVIGKKEVGGKINKAEILGIGKITAKYSDDFPLSSTPTIQSCKVSLMKGSDFTQPTDAPGGIFTAAQITAIRGLRKNESVSLEMVVRGADGITYTINRTMTIL
jgi:gliding motility-associated protein GldM